MRNSGQGSSHFHLVNNPIEQKAKPTFPGLPGQKPNRAFTRFMRRRGGLPGQEPMLPGLPGRKPAPQKPKEELPGSNEQGMPVAY